MQGFSPLLWRSCTGGNKICVRYLCLRCCWEKKVKRWTAYFVRLGLSCRLLSRRWLQALYWSTWFLRRIWKCRKLNIVRNSIYSWNLRNQKKFRKGKRFFPEGTIYKAWIWRCELLYGVDILTGIRRINKHKHSN